MTKALFKKQMMEVFSWLFQNKRTGKNRSGKGTVAYALLYLVLLAIFAVLFFTMAAMLCGPLVSAGLGWLYFAIMGLISVALGVFGSVFSTYSTLYLAKDNDLLLSMPVPARKILLVRLSGVYATGLMYELVVMIPTLIAYFMQAKVGAAGIVCSLLIPLVLSVFVLTLSCILGWVVALISGRLRNKNFIVVILSLAFIGAYYYLYAQAYSMLQSILSNAQAVGDGIRSYLYPLYHMGLAAEGNVLSMVIFTAIIAALFGIVYLVLARSFLKLTTINRGAAKVKYKEKAAKAGSVGGALFRKELKRFLGSSTYMLNCGLGIVLMVVAAVALVIKADTVAEVLFELFEGMEGIVPLLAAAAVCVMTCMNIISAPSVSLEGKNLWLVQSFPVSARQVLLAKLKLHLALTLPPALILTACVEIVIRPSAAFAVLLPVAVSVFTLFLGLLGLVLNLKLPNLNWTNETVPVKQGMSGMLTLFGGWVLVAALCGLYAGVRKFLSPELYLACGALALLAVSLALLAWLKQKGAKIFEAL